MFMFFIILSCSWFKQIEGTKLPDLSSKKLIDAGFVFKYGLEEMVDDAIQCCKRKGYLWDSYVPFFMLSINRDKNYLYEKWLFRLAIGAWCFWDWDAIENKLLRA